ncbi:MAG: helix-hairpin-helix domain-containing protein [Sporichthyaceae bacterium]|nr:helix-hairpin-helix domain-containing protein [Sporichthyaceae bacterium]
MPERVDINIATKEELATLPGVGETIAENITVFRAEHGRFAAIDELLDVEGITRRLLKRLRGLVTVDTGPSGSPMPESVDIQLSSTSGGDFTEHSVTIAGVRRVERDEEAQDLPFASSAPTDRTGLATLTIPARSTIIGQVTLRATAPDGELLKSESQAGASLPRKRDT